MKNKLEILDTAEGYIAVFSGETGGGEIVTEEEGHNLRGETKEEREVEALQIWGAEKEETLISHS